MSDSEENNQNSNENANSSSQEAPETSCLRKTFVSSLEGLAWMIFFVGFFYHSFVNLSYDGLKNDLEHVKERYEERLNLCVKANITDFHSNYWPKAPTESDWSRIGVLHGWTIATMFLGFYYYIIVKIIIGRAKWRRIKELEKKIHDLSNPDSNDSTSTNSQPRNKLYQRYWQWMGGPRNEDPNPGPHEYEEACYPWCARICQMFSHCIITAWYLYYQIKVIINMASEANNRIRFLEGISIFIFAFHLLFWLFWLVVFFFPMIRDGIIKSRRAIKNSIEMA